MPKTHPKTESGGLADWVKSTQKPTRRCRICLDPRKAELVRELIAAMRRAKVRVSYDKIAAKIQKDLGGPPTAVNSVRGHLFTHEPAWRELLDSLGK